METDTPDDDTPQGGVQVNSPSVREFARTVLRNPRTRRWLSCTALGASGYAAGLLTVYLLDRAHRVPPSRFARARTAAANSAVSCVDALRQHVPLG